MYHHRIQISEEISQPLILDKYNTFFHAFWVKPASLCRFMHVRFLYSFFQKNSKYPLTGIVNVSSRSKGILKISKFCERWMQKRWRSKKRGIPEGSNFSLRGGRCYRDGEVRSLSEEKKEGEEEEREKERERKKTGRDQTELRLHKKAPGPLLSRICPHEHVRGSTVRGPTIEESR